MNFIKALVTKFSTLSTAGKIGVALSMVVSVTAIGGGTFYVSKQIVKQNKIKEEEKLKQDTLNSYEIKDNLVFEFGDKILLEPETFVSVKNMDLYDEMKLIVSSTYEDGKEYLAVGTHKGKVEYKETSKEFIFEVKDTTAPIFKDFKDTIELYVSSENTMDGLKTYFLADDLSGILEISFINECDLSKVGTYKTKVTAKDKHGNVACESITIVIKDKPKIPINNGGSSFDSSSSSDDKIIADSGGKIPGYDGDGDGVVSRPSYDHSSSDSSKVCVPGGPDPSKIGNSGLLFYGDDDYYAWESAFLQSDEYYAMDGFSSWFIKVDCMGNDITNKRIWTVEWW